MGRGRPPKPGSAEEKAATRREQVRNNVRALRERRKEQVAAATAVRGGKSAHSDLNETGSSCTVSNGGEDKRKHASTETRSPAGLPSADADGWNLPVQRDKVTPRSMVQVDSTNAYVLALLDTFRKMFLPDTAYLPPDARSLTRRPWDKQQLLWTPCAYFATSSFANASTRENSLVRIALLSIGILLKSLEYNDLSLRAAAMQMYRRSLKGIRARLDCIVQGRPQKQEDVITLYQSCHAAAMFELVENPDLNATQRHLRGVGQLICHMAHTFDEEGQAMAWSLLQDYRFAELGLCLKLRYVSYSSTAKWNFEEAVGSNRSCPSSPTHLKPTRACRSHGILVIIADFADDISAIMLRFDSLQHHPTRYDFPAELRDCLEQLDDIWQKVPLIQSQLLEAYREAIVCIRTSCGRDSISSYIFKRYDVATAWCSNLMTQLYCLETSVEVATLLMTSHTDAALKALYGTQASSIMAGIKMLPVDQPNIKNRLDEYRRLHRAICIQLTRSLSFFWQMDKGVAGQALAIYPLDAVLTMLGKETQRLEVDLERARSTESQQYIDTILRNTAMIGSARRSVQEMQNKGKRYGMPSLNERNAGDIGDSYSILQKLGRVHTEL